VVFAFLPNKRKYTYIRLFRNILRHDPEWTPKNVTVDFEAATISALAVENTTSENTWVSFPHEQMHLEKSARIWDYFGVQGK